MDVYNDVHQFSKNAYDTFELLQLPKDKKRVLIIPDGLLYYIPFEALMTEENKAIRFEKMPFFYGSFRKFWKCFACSFSLARLLKIASAGVG